MEIPSQLQLRKEPKQQRSRQLVQSVLDSAIAMSEQHGLAALNTNAIAEHAGIDIASIYQYFPNKESILFWAAERWLRGIRDVCQQMDEPQYQQLPWADFFAAYGELVVALPDHKRAFSSLRSLWVLYPEYQFLADEHRDFMVNFLVGHFRRLGAKRSQKALQGLATYLFLSSNSILEVAMKTTSDEELELLDWNYQTWMSHLSRILPD